MSQAVTYKTKFQNLAQIKKHIDNLIKEGKVFGKDATVTMKGQPGFSTSGWYRINKEQIIMIVKAKNPEDGIFGSKEAGEILYRGQEGFAVLFDPATKEISIAVETNNSEEDDPRCKRMKKLIEKHIDSPMKKQALRDALAKAGVTIIDKPGGGWIAEGEIPEEMLAGIQAIKAQKSGG